MILSRNFRVKKSKNKILLLYPEDFWGHTWKAPDDLATCAWVENEKLYAIPGERQAEIPLDVLKDFLEFVENNSEEK
jgi:hypothetical protein